MKKFLSILCFLLAGLTIFAGVGNLVIRSFYGFEPKAWFVALILAVSGELIWVGVRLWKEK
jgi:energy-converting hydrogenase Eha subunit G